MSTVVALPTNPSALTVGRVAELFLDSLANPNTLRGYATAVGKTAAKLGEDRPLATVTDDEVGEALESLWGQAAVGTWNARRAAVGSWLSWCRERHEAPAVPRWCKRLAYWDAGTARLLPRLLKGRCGGPVFTTHRRPGPGKVLGPRDTCPDTGLARLSYGQARALLDAHTAHRGPGTGWDLHEFRHSALTHLGEAGASLLLLMAKSRHKKPENVRRYFKPSDQALAEITGLLAPGDSRR
ncbi:site-specific integrase [Saccharopolyspora karakumensis]|uniref:Site-specific integrase n=1 Tax=Saccharopolyspora karakumensis TaxID=2530386 RepID=A0A4R5B5I7_9PSEU|nr:site-specific integrase [Saccharopolyspora karakumensis]TDD81498.1 site-specific integrase [Saccharopolyspora karakumensis]